MRMNCHSIRVKWLGAVLLLGLSLHLPAQQRMQQSQYLTNAFLVNPALAGTEQYLDLKLGYQHLWAGFEGAPRSLFISAHRGLLQNPGNLKGNEVSSLPAPGRGRYLPTFKEKGPDQLEPMRRITMGVGGMLYSEQTGPVSYNGLGFSYSVNLLFKGDWHLALGANLDLMNYRVDPDQVTLTDPNDLTVLGSRNSLFLPGINMGFALFNNNFFIAGSSRQLLQNRITIGPDNPFISSLAVHSHLQAGYRFKVGDDFRLTPTAALRYVQSAPSSWEVGARAEYQDLFTFGASIRWTDALTGNALVGLIGFRLTDRINLNYSYDLAINGLSGYNSGTHGITLGFKMLPSKRQPGKKPFERRYFW